jgi:hypothetical protein
MRNLKKLFLIIIFILILITIPYLLFEGQSHELIGSNDMGYVTKDVYNYYNAEQTIIVITGIHPREKLAINPEIESVKRFAMTHRANVINYNVTVTKAPEDYKNCRYNGEHLVAQYILPDINQSRGDVVIISHSHVEGYGEGFYIATPAMDEASVRIGEEINNSNINFNYYRTPTNETYKSTSIELVSKPLADSGYPTLVYEIPENISETDSTDRTYDLLVKTYEILN